MNITKVVKYYPIKVSHLVEVQNTTNNKGYDNKYD